MKSLLLSIFLLISNLVFCQDWFPFPVGQRSYFEKYEQYNNPPIIPTDTTIQSYEIDSVLISGSKSTYYFNYKNPNLINCYKDILDFHSSANLTPQFNDHHLPDSLITNLDSLWMYFPLDSLPLLIIPSANPGDSWFSDYNGSNYNKLKFTCDNKFFGNILNVLDSIKIISVQTYLDSFPVVSPFNSKKLILSKNYGLKDFFPYDSKLIGFKNSIISEGFNEPDLQEYFNLIASDVLIWKHVSDAGFFDPEVITYYKDSIIAVNSSPLNVSYSVIRTNQNGSINNYTYNYNYSDLEGLFVGTCSFTNQINSNTILSSGAINETSPLYYDANGYVNRAFILSYAQEMNPCELMPNYDFSLCILINSKYGIYSRYDSFGVDESYQSWTIEGSVIDGIQEGILWNDIVTSIESNSSIFEYTIYPNPVQKNNTIQIEGTDLEKAEIINLQGKIVYQSELTNNQLNININQGIYFLKVTNSKGINTSKKLIVN
ncbi:MAG: T9SS type A sorting domain-containing protein [Flavobacteriales bacterium]|nr:T9SS type A sorting domain-containing protein [Flavobacteriales bacterium]